jgi:hypothetical protein
MNALRRWLAFALMDLCAAVLPAVKSEWLRAMRAEAARIEDHEAFNLGAAAWLFGANVTEVSASNTQLISAVAFEGVVILAAMLGLIFLFARILPSSQDASRFSNAIGRMD